MTGWDLDREKFIGVYNGFHNPQGVQHGVVSLTVNGKAVEGNLIPAALMTPRTIVTVELQADGSGAEQEI